MVISKRIAIAALAIVAITSPAHSGPEGAQVVQGEVTVTQSGGQWVITASDGSIINYSSFDIALQELVQFIQPHDMARVLNRINGAAPTVIQGQLLANGHVYLVNPAGVLFTGSAVVDAAGLHAAAGHISNQDFSDGIDHYTGLSGSVVNSGTIRGTTVRLLGNSVANHGTITAPEGLVVMVAGQQVLLTQHDSHIMVKLDGAALQGSSPTGTTTPDLTAAPGVENTGTITADHGQVVLGAGDHYALAIRNSGQIAGDGAHVSAVSRGGLVHNQGTIVAESIDVTGTDIALDGGNIESSGSQVYTGHVQVGQDSVLTGSTITFNGPIDSSSIPAGSDGHALTLNGDAIIGGNVGEVSPLRSLVVNGATTLDAAMVVTQDLQEYGGPLTLEQDVVLTSLDGGDVVFGGTVDGAVALSVETSGVTHFQDLVGGATPLSSVTTDATGTTVIGAAVNAGTLELNDSVVLAGPVALNADHSVAIAAGLNGCGHPLTIVAPVSTLSGNVVGLGALTITGDTLLLGADLSAGTLDLNAAIELLGDVTITGGWLVDLNGTIDGPHRLTVTSAGDVRFGGDVGGQTALLALTTSAGGVVMIDANLLRATGNIEFNRAGHDQVPEVATIGATGGDLTIESSGGDIFLGANEKLSVAKGGLSLLAAGGTVTVGDLNSLGDLTVAAAQIRVRTRSPGQVLTSQGELVDDGGVDIVAGGDILFTRTPILIGGGAAPIFANPSGSTTGDALEGFVVRAIPDIDPSAFTLGQSVLDLMAAPAGTLPAGILDSGLAGAVPRWLMPVEDGVQRDPVAVRALQRLGLYIRTLDDAELLTLLERSTLFSDISGGLGDFGLDPAPTAVNRLRAESVLDVVDRYRQLFATAPGPLGEPPEDPAAPIHRVLTETWRQYRIAQPGEPSAAEYRHFLQEAADVGGADSAQAHAYLDGLAGLLEQIRIMGVSARELRRSARSVLGPLKPTAMDYSTLAQAVGFVVPGLKEPPRRRPAQIRSSR